MKRHGLGRRLTRYNLRFDDIPEKDLAYFAGLFDGEGNITASIDEHGAVRVEVSVVNTDALLLECLRFFTHYRFRENMGLHRETPTHVLYTHNFKDTYSLLRAILPYLKLKKTRAELMIRLCESRMEHFRKPLTVEERNLVAKIRALNGRKRKRR